MNPINTPAFQSINDWPESSLLTRLLFENFWPGLLVFTVIALMFCFYGLKSGSKNQLITALILLLAAGVFPTLSIAVTTSREHLIALTARLADATVPPQDLDQLHQMFDENIALHVMGSAVFTNRKDLLEAATRVEAAYRFGEHAILSIDAVQIDDARAQSYLQLRTPIEGTGSSDFGAPTSAWLIDWRRPNPDTEWTISSIMWLKIMGIVDPSPGLIP